MNFKETFIINDVIFYCENKIFDLRLWLHSLFRKGNAVASLL